jgi:hypothetical protein
MIVAAWFIGFILEVSGAALAFQKHKPLFFYLSFCAFAEIVTAVILLSAGGDVYGYAAWVAHFIGSGLMIWLICYLIAAMANEYLKAVYPGMIAVFLAALCIAIFSHGETLTDKLLDTGISASFFLALFLLVGLMSKKYHLNRQLTLIAWAVCISLASDGLIVGLSRFWLNALHFIPLGSLAALVLWNVAVWRKMAIRIEFAKEELDLAIRF